MSRAQRWVLVIGLIVIGVELVRFGNESPYGLESIGRYYAGDLLGMIAFFSAAFVIAGWRKRGPQQ